ncbi:MAG: family 20 glycosylhydrolase [Acidobacteriota bacterium]|nr:family 20 glycosylhydrolase [Acidobacteriota bacterium]MDW3228495.1 family 20 glycosylhydrolase [Acidobacteriota bacterium]
MTANSFKKYKIFISVLLTGFICLFLIAAGSLQAESPSGTTEQISNLPPMMPVPAKIEPVEGSFRLDEKFSVGGQAKPTSRAFKAVGRFMSRLAGHAGIFLEQDFLADQSLKTSTKFIYKFERVGQLEPDEDESYHLEITPEKVKLQSKTDLGLLRGLETLLQLLSVDSQGYYFPCLIIQDQPRFTWRGLLIDSCRHFMPLEVIKRNLLAMASVKLNVLHWHLSEDQGFRVESKTFPRLHQLGSDGMYYSQEQIKEIIQFASDLGIRVMPEFDIPGHSTSWLVGYPEYASAPGPYRIERKFGVFHPAFNPANPKVYDFFDKFFREMASLFPDPYLHIGGDEVEAVHWKENPQVQAFMKKHHLSDYQALQAYFNQEILKILTRYRKKMVGWDEIYQPGLPKDIVIHSWRGPQALVDGARKGYQGILSNGYYIDLCETAERHYLNDPIPPGSLLTPEEKKLILGGEATMWAELVSPETVDSRIWPRTAAIAERLWSPQEVRDVDDMYERLKVISVQLEETGVQHLKNQQMLLRRLISPAGSDLLKIGTLKAPFTIDKLEALQRLAAICEPVKGYARHNQGRTYTSLAPLTRFVDACFPESLEAREFRKIVKNYIEARQPETARKIINYLAGLYIIVPRIETVSEQIPSLKEIRPLADDLIHLSFIALYTLQLAEGGEKISNSWIETQKVMIQEIKKPKAECLLAITPAVELLLESLSSPGGK